MSAIGLLLTFSATTIAQPAPSKPQVSNIPPQVANVVYSRQFVSPASTPDYTKDVLKPLYTKQYDKLVKCNSIGGTVEGDRCVPPPSPAPPPPPPVEYVPPPNVTYSLPTDQYKLLVYQRESGNNPGAINRYSGACGLGQALPCSKMGCSLSDYACQDAWFTSYMLGRYGSWAAAWQHELTYGWW